MADAEDLKSSGDFSSCGFDSHPGHQFRCSKSEFVSEVAAKTLASLPATPRDSGSLLEWPSPGIEAGHSPQPRRSQPNPVGSRTTALLPEAASPDSHCR